MTGQRIAIDIGSTNITVFVEGKGIVFCEPSCIVFDKYNGKTVATGVEAKKMEGKMPGSLDIIYPIKNGFINDYGKTVKMLRGYLDRICRGRILRPSVLMCVPGVVTQLERRTIFDAAIEAGAGKVCFVDQALASAAGAGVDLTSPVGALICDIGASTSDCAAVAGGNIVFSSYKSIGGNDFNRALKDYIFRKYNMSISDDTAEILKKTAGTAIERDEEVAVLVCGKYLFDACPKNFEVTSTDILEAFEGPLNEITESILYILQNISPELCSDVYENGIIMTGGMSNLYGIDRLITKKTGIKTIKPESPELCAALGMGTLLKDIDFLTRHDYIFRASEDKEIADE